MPQPITSTRVCEMFDITPRTLYQWEREKKTPAPARDRRLGIKKGGAATAVMLFK